MHDCSGEPVICPDEHGLLWTDVSGIKFESGAPTSGEELEGEKIKKKR